MAITSILALLATEVGIPAAKKVMEKVSSSSNNQNKLIKVNESIQAGASAVSALRDAFGNVFDEALSAAVGSGAHGWTYEAGRAEYIVVGTEGTSKNNIDILRDELSINLDRIRKIPHKDENEIGNYFRGIFSIWMERYENLIGVDKNAKNTFETISKLIDGDQRNYRDVLRVLLRAGLGVTSILMFLYAGMLYTNAGLGFFTWAHIGIFGIPMLKIAIFVIPATMLLLLSGIKYPQKKIRTSCVALAYGLLKRHSKSSKKRS